MSSALDGLDRLVASLDYPMAIVTCAAGDERAGCLVGFTTQCSIHPLRWLVCISKANHTFGVACRAEVLVVHFPGPAQLDVAALFGEETGDEVDKFARCDWRPGPGDAPVLADVPRWLAGRVLDRIDLGDHVGFVLEPVDAACDLAEPQLGFQSVKDLQPGHPV
jgi:flavin reductase (DIM6/NTAB) family NADH-FMN oxidoreductase RutF